jgi:hypothetical protein
MNNLDPITFHLSPLIWEKRELVRTDHCLTLGLVRELVRPL